MSNFHGNNKKKNYFEGWYFKHQNKNSTLAFIPGINIDERGKKNAFIQIISNRNSYNIEFPFSSFKVSNGRLEIIIGKNRFHKDGIEINIENNDVTVSGKLKYGEFKPIEYSIMGPFRFLPFMECNHGIISLYHSLSGEIIINGEKIDFNKGIGYIEKDWGTSFPKSYLWIHCNDFIYEKCSIMVSIADIPFMGINFKGCICVIYYGEREFRLATYKRVSIRRHSRKEVILEQGKYRLEIQITEMESQKLLAPSRGNMIRTIHENAACTGRFRFYIKDEEVFNLKSNNCGFEYVL